MAFEKKLPSIRVTLSIEEYNKLIQLLSETEGLNKEELEDKVNDIKDKLLHYTQQSGEDKVLMRFYPSQMEILLYILLSKTKQIQVSEDYYKVLMSNKEKYRQEILQKNKNKN